VISHQNACIFDGELVAVDEYDGTVEDDAAGATLAASIGSASGVQLAHHGAVVIGPTVEAACHLAATYERMCRFTLAALQAGSPLLPLPVAGRAELQAELRANAPGAYWAGAARRVLRTTPDVLE
jgi:ribulose-5-phosphate 4-epimerase/fuculose-1-phosphate aldolase